MFPTSNLHYPPFLGDFPMKSPWCPSSNARRKHIALLLPVAQASPPKESSSVAPWRIPTRCPPVFRPEVSWPQNGSWCYHGMPQSGDNFCWISWSLWEINQNHMISLGFHGTWWLSRDLLGNPGGLAMEVLERANYPRGSFTVGIPSQKRRYFLPFQWSNIGLNMVELNFEPCEPLRIALSYLIILSWLIGFPTTYYETHQFGSISIYKSLYSPLNQAIYNRWCQACGIPPNEHEIRQVAVWHTVTARCKTSGIALLKRATSPSVAKRGWKEAPWAGCLG